MQKTVLNISPPKELIGLDDCHDGLVVAEDIVTNRGILLLPKNTMINSYILNRLINHGIYQIYVYPQMKKKSAITTDSYGNIYYKSLNSTKYLITCAGKKYQVSKPRFIFAKAHLMY